MKKSILLSIIFFCTSIYIKAQNTIFNDVSIGIDYPTYGTKIKTNFPGYNGPWGRAYFIANETGEKSFFAFASSGSSINGVSTVTSSFIGKDMDTRYMTFLPNANIGIGTSNPQSILQIGEFNNGLNYKLSLPGAYNFEEIKLGQYGNGRNGLEMISHTNLTNSFGVRLFAGTDTGMNGLQIQTADPASSNQNLNYSTKMAIDLAGNVGIGTISPRGTLELTKLNSNLLFDLNTNSLCKIISTGWNANIDMHTFQINGIENQNQLYLNTNGNIGIGTTNTTSKLTVAGNIASREVKVTVDAGADFVFENDYNLPSLESIDKFIKENKHLPEIASAKEMQKDGINLSEMNIKLLQKMEEMTLYMIEQNKKLNELEKQNRKFTDLERRLEKIEKSK